MPDFGSVAVGNHPRSHSSVASADASAAASEAAMQPVLLALAEVLVGGRGAGADAGADAGAGVIGRVSSAGAMLPASSKKAKQAAWTYGRRSAEQRGRTDCLQRNWRD